MSNDKTTIGIDFRGDLFYVARVDHHAGRPEIKALVRLERKHLGEHHLLQGGRVVLSIPDEAATIRKIELDSEADDFETRARFELAQSLLEDEAEFHFDVLPTSQGYHLGMILRRAKLNALRDHLLADKKDSFPNAAYKTRANALADGYVHFCRTDSSNLVCLADFIANAVSIALVYDGRLLDITHLPLDRYDLGNEDDLRRLAVEFKTSVNYTISSVFAAGVTTPLSALFVSGEATTGVLTDILKEHFPIEITGPRLNPGFFTGRSDLSEIPLEKYLVALGLAAN